MIINNSQKPNKLFMEAFILFLLNLLIFCGAFILSFYLMKNKLHPQAVDVPLIKSGFDYKGLDNIILIKKWTPFIGIAIGTLFSSIIFILMLIFTKLRRKSNIVSLIIYFFIMTLFGFLAFDLVYLEPRYTAIGSAIKSFVGVPFGIAIIAATLNFIIWFLVKSFATAGKAIVVLFCMASLAGCSLGFSSDIACDFNPDSDHCYQFSAVQSGDPEICEKIEGESFKGQNPPKDKCFLMTAVNLGKYEICDQIEGGLNSYSKEQCVMNVAVAKKDIEQCKKLTSEDLKIECAEKIPQEGDNPLKENEKPVAKATNINGDIRVIKEDGRIIPLTKDSVLGPKDKISSLEEGSTFTLEIYGVGTYCVPQNTMIAMDKEYVGLENGCQAVSSIR